MSAHSSFRSRSPVRWCSRRRRRASRSTDPYQRLDRCHTDPVAAARGYGDVAGSLGRSRDDRRRPRQTPAGQSRSAADLVSVGGLGQRGRQSGSLLALRTMGTHDRRHAPSMVFPVLVLALNVDDAIRFAAPSPTVPQPLKSTLCRPSWSQVCRPSRLRRRFAARRSPTCRPRSNYCWRRFPGLFARPSVRS